MNYTKIRLAVLFFLTGMFLTSCAPKAFQIVCMPDTQTYSRLYPEIYDAQTKWAADNADKIAFVLQQGDITDDNVEAQWQVASNAMSRMDGKVAYTFVPGNHDLGRNSNVRNSDLFNKYFPYDKYSKMPGFGGAFEDGKMDNTWHIFKAGGYNWLILSLEFGPRNSVLKWAEDVIKNHPRHKVIINTHAYMYSDNTRMGPGDDWLPQGYGLGKAKGDSAVNNGEEIWDKLVSKYSNIMFVFSGHVLHSGTGKLVSDGINGNKVYQMLANYQDGVKGTVKGGNGFLRILSIDTKAKVVSVKTFSPYINQFKTDGDNQFVFEDVKF